MTTDIHCSGAASKHRREHFRKYFIYTVTLQNMYVSMSIPQIQKPRTRVNAGGHTVVRGVGVSIRTQHRHPAMKQTSPSGGWIPCFAHRQALLPPQPPPARAPWHPPSAELQKSEITRSSLLRKKVA